MPLKLQKDVEKKLISLIVGKTTRYNQSGEWAGELKNRLETWLEIDYVWGIKFRTKGWRLINMRKLSYKVALLLAITHRPLFEIYKKYLQNNNLTQEYTK